LNPSNSLRSFSHGTNGEALSTFVAMVTRSVRLAGTRAAVGTWGQALHLGGVLEQYLENGLVEGDEGAVVVVQAGHLARGVDHGQAVVQLQVDPLGVQTPDEGLGGIVVRLLGSHPKTVPLR